MNETGTVSKRIEWVDIAKGVAIVLVCLGHRDVPKCLDEWISSFHLPLFFFLAGYTTRFEVYANFWAYAARKVRVLLVPYLVFGLAGMAFSYCFEFFYRHQIIPLTDALLVLLDGRGYGSLWFILPLFVVEVVSYPLNLLPKGKTVVVILCAFGGYALSLAFRESHIFWNLNVALISLFFFWFARLIRNSRINERFAKGDAAFFLCAIIVHAICLAFNTRISMVFKRFGIFPLFLIGGVAGSVVVASVCARLEKTRYVKRVLTYFGKNTLPIVAFHYYPGYMILETLFYKLFGLKYLNNVFSYNIEGFVYTIVILLLCVPIIEFVNRFAPWAVGGRVVKKKKEILQTSDAARL